MLSGGWQIPDLAILEPDTVFHRRPISPLPSLPLCRCRIVSVRLIPTLTTQTIARQMRLLGFYGRQFIRLFSLPPKAIPFVFAAEWFC
jgi:hypothetical protein